MSKIKSSSGLIDTRLYENPVLLAHILCLLDRQITNDEKEIIKNKFLIKENEE